MFGQMISSARLVKAEAVGLAGETIWYRPSATETTLMRKVEEGMIWYLTYRTVTVGGSVVGVEMVGTLVEILGDGGQGPLVQGESETADGMIIDVNETRWPGPTPFTY